MAWNNQSKNTASFGNQSKNQSVWDNFGQGVLLLENSYRLLRENGSKIILEQGVKHTEIWANQAKS